MSKKGLAYFLNMRYNRDTRQIEAGREAVPAPHAPMQERTLLHNSIAAPALIISKTPPFIKRRFLRVCVCQLRCGVIISCAAFVCFGGSAQRGPGGSHPQGTRRRGTPKSEKREVKRNEKTEKGTFPIFGTGPVLGFGSPGVCGGETKSKHYL